MSRAFDKVDDIITCGVAGTVEDLDDLTILADINPIDSGEGNIGIILRQEASGVFRNRFSLDGTVNALRLAYSRLRSTLVLSYTSNTSVTANVWNHVAVTFSTGGGAGTLAAFYINGNLTGYDTATDGSGIYTGGSTAQYIGNNSGTSLTFNGKIANIQYFNRRLSVDEMVQARRYPGSIRNGLVGYWPLWGGSPEPDYSGNGNHGTLTGTMVSSDNPPINGIFQVPSPNLYYSSFSTGAAPTSATARINRMMLMGVR